MSMFVCLYTILCVCEEGEGERGRFILLPYISSVDSSYLAPDMSNLMPGFEPAIDIDQQTDSNHDTALTLAAAGMYDYIDF